MKPKFVTALSFLFVSIFLFATPAKSQHKEFEEWKELKDFHEVISATFHPMEKGNYKPIRERSLELKKAAKMLAESKIPSELNTKEIQKALQDLVANTSEMDLIVNAKGTDEKVKTMLTIVHDNFHKIVGLCSGKEGSNHEKQEEGKEKEKK